jgi:hypothetical protein
MRQDGQDFVLSATNLADLLARRLRGGPRPLGAAGLRTRAAASLRLGFFSKLLTAFPKVPEQSHVVTPDLEQRVAAHRVNEFAVYVRLTRDVGADEYLTRVPRNGTLASLSRVLHICCAGARR